MPDPNYQKYIFDVMEDINNLESFTTNITLDKLEEIEFKWAIESRERYINNWRSSI